jgi:hypothetical protein
MRVDYAIKNHLTDTSHTENRTSFFSNPVLRFFSQLIVGLFKGKALSRNNASNNSQFIKSKLNINFKKSYANANEKLII